MYTGYFGFTENPFNLTPNPRYLFLSRHHREAFAHLLYGIDNHYGFIALTGEIGTGKTTVLRTLLEQLQDDRYRTALIFNPCLTATELLHGIATEFGLSNPGCHTGELLATLNRFLLEERSAGRTVVLVIDEAQNLHPDVLEQVRLLSNLETVTDKLIQIILAGQPELDRLLRRHDLRQLNQRIAVRYHLRAMNAGETCEYLTHRMNVAGNRNGVRFTTAALRLLHWFSAGVPRIINILADRSLLIAYGDECHTVTAGMLFTARRELSELTPGLRRTAQWMLTMLLYGFSVMALFLLLFLLPVFATPLLGWLLP